jgi:hypothetical protein
MRIAILAAVGVERVELEHRYRCRHFAHWKER